MPETPTATKIYRPGGPTHQRWLKDLAAANKVVVEHDALVHDHGWTGVDPDKLPEGFADYYSGLRQIGHRHGWVAA